MKRVTIAFLVAAFCILPFRVYADIAPPLNPPGTNLEPGTESTQVRMVAETVLIDVKDDRTPGSLGTAVITAVFSMRNLGTRDERMAVRFPISANDGRDRYPLVSGVVVRVDGSRVPTRNADYPDLRFPERTASWAEFDVSFPVEEDVRIEVAYSLEGSGYSPYAAYYYVLETGAGWKDTIGSADITLRLPYPASPQNIVLDLQIGWAETTPGGVLRGNEMQWHFGEFEPGTDGGIARMEFALVTPAAWRIVLNEREAVSRSAGDGEAWGRLGKAYKEIFLLTKGFREDVGGAELYGLSVEAYENSLVLLPDDAQWHAGFADLLAAHAYWARGGTGAPPAEIYRALEEIHTAMRLAPNDVKVLEIAERIFWLFPEAMPTTESGYDFAWLTQTPTSRPSVIPTARVDATITPNVVESAPVPSRTPSPAPRPISPSCGSAAMLPAAIAFWSWRRRMRSAADPPVQP